MKVVHQTIAAGPEGIVKPGMVLDLPEAEAKERIEGRYARPFDRERDSKAQYGPIKTPERYDR